jgi:hypothetical protein
VLNNKSKIWKSVVLQLVVIATQNILKTAKYKVNRNKFNKELWDNLKKIIKLHWDLIEKWIKGQYQNRFYL